MKSVDNRNGEQVGSEVHIFERAGLGKAPFVFTGMNVHKYQACPGAPIQPGGTCDYCGEAIIYEFFLKSADGKSFKVGSDCICKHDSSGLRRVVDAKVREIKRQQNIARQDARIAKALELLPKVEAKLKATPHPVEHWAKQGQTSYDCIAWYIKHAGRSGKCWAAKHIEDAAKDLGNPQSV